MASPAPIVTDAHPGDDTLGGRDVLAALRGRAAGLVHGRSKAELGFYAAVTLLGLALRLLELGARAFHHDESQDAYFSYQFFQTGDYQYNPLLHGPLRFYLTALMYLLFGDSNFTARLAPALMGTAMIAMPYLIRRQIGRVGAGVAAVLLAVGPSYLYFSRFAREDIYIASVTLLLLCLIVRFLAGPATRSETIWIVALIAVSFSIKESTYITVFSIGTCAIAVVLWQLLSPGQVSGETGWRRSWVLTRAADLGWETWVWALVAFLGVFTLLFTTFLTHPAGLWDGIHDSIAYWLSQQPVARGGEPPGFYVFLLVYEELPTLILGLIGSAIAIRMRSVPLIFLVWMFVLQLAVYSWAGEKFAWLVLHPLLPLILLTGLAVDRVWAARGERWAHVAAVGLAVGAVHVGWMSWWSNVKLPDDPRSVIVSTQSSPTTREVAKAIVQANAALGSNPGITAVQVDSADGASFPWAWYLRHVPGSYADLSVTGAASSPILVLTEASRNRLLGSLDGYVGRQFHMRVWWVKAYGSQSLGNWWTWTTRLRPWNETGGMTEYVYIRKDLADRVGFTAGVTGEPFTAR